MFAMANGGLATSMGRETNPNSILALDKRIEELTAELIQLKRSRNSLLDVGRVPPEILGHIFRFNITTEVGDPQFAGIQKGSYNFLLVCHHWFEVAHRIPELWSFWGNRLEDWKRQHPRSGTSPPKLDLVLDGMERRLGSFDGDLQDALRDYAARDAIRKVHLRGDDIPLLTTIVSSLTPEDYQESSIESIALSGVDASHFLFQHNFKKLRDLSLSGRFMLSYWAWNSLSQTTTLINLSLSSNSLFEIPTTSQLLSILASNPNIRTLVLESLRVHDSEDNSDFRVPMRHLEKLTLEGRPKHIFPILHRLELPEKMDHARLELDCMLYEVGEIVGPYIRDYLGRDPRFGDRLGISLSRTSGGISLRVSVIGVGYHGPDKLPQQAPRMRRFR